MIPELGNPKSYPAMDLLRGHGRAVTGIAAAAVFLTASGGAEGRRLPGVLRGLALAALVGVAVKNLSELNEVIADTLLPR